MGLQSFLLTFLLPGVDPGVYAKAALTPARGTWFLKSFAPGFRGGNSWWLYQIAAAPKGPDKPSHARIPASTQASSLHPAQFNVKRGPSRYSGWGLSGLDAPDYRRFALGKSKGEPVPRLAQGFFS